MEQEQVISVLLAPGPRIVEHQIRSSLFASLTGVVVREKRSFSRGGSLKECVLSYGLFQHLLWGFLFLQVTMGLLPPWLCCPANLTCLPHVS